MQNVFCVIYYAHKFEEYKSINAWKIVQNL